MKSVILKISQNGISGTGRPIKLLFDSRCLLSAASEPHRLPACIICLLGLLITCATLC